MKYSVCCALFITLFLLTAGCGDDSDFEAEFSGKVLAEDGNPLANISVSIPGTGSEALTDDEGYFSFDAEPGTSDVILEFRSESLAVNLQIHGVPSDAAGVDVTVTIDTAINEIVSSDVEIIDADSRVVVVMPAFLRETRAPVNRE